MKAHVFTKCSPAFPRARQRKCMKIVLFLERSMRPFSSKHGCLCRAVFQRVKSDHSYNLTTYLPYVLVSHLPSCLDVRFELLAHKRAACECVHRLAAVCFWWGGKITGWLALTTTKTTATTYIWHYFCQIRSTFVKIYILDCSAHPYNSPKFASELRWPVHTDLDTLRIGKQMCFYCTVSIHCNSCI